MSDDVREWIFWPLASVWIFGSATFGWVCLRRTRDMKTEGGSKRDFGSGSNGEGGMDRRSGDFKKTKSDIQI